MSKKTTEKGKVTNDDIKVKAWDNVRELSESKIGTKVLSEHRELIEGFERLMVITSPTNISKFDQEDLEEQIKPIMDAVGEVSGSAVVLENGEERNVRAIFMDVLKHIQARVEKKWEEDIINFLFGIKKQRGINHLKYSEMSGLSHSYICRLDNEKRKALSLDAFKKLSNGLGFTMQEVLDMYSGDQINENVVSTFDDVVKTNSFEIAGSLATKKKKKKISNLVTSLEAIEWEENMDSIAKVVAVMNEYFS